MAFEVGAIVEGTVVKIAEFGAFVELPDGKTGLVHISEIANTYVTDIQAFVKQGQQVKVKVVGINDKGKYDLSIKQLEPKLEEPRKRPRFRMKAKTLGEAENDGNRRPEHLSFEDKLAHFMKESEERLLDLKRNVEAKRGKGRIK